MKPDTNGRKKTENPVENATGQGEKAIQGILIALFVLSVFAFPVGVLADRILALRFPIPETVYPFVKYSWVFYPMGIVPLLSLVGGVVFTRRGLRSVKNVVAGGVALFLTLVFGSLWIFFSGVYSEEYAYVGYVQEEIYVQLPAEGYATVSYGGDALTRSARRGKQKGEEYTVAYVRFKEGEDLDAFVTAASASPLWLKDGAFVSGLDPHAYRVTAEFDLFLLYDRARGLYNVVAGDDLTDSIFLAYDVDTNLMFIVERRPSA